MTSAGRICIGISGGVDSAIAALLLSKQGCDVVGCTMALGRPGEEKSITDAKAVADWLGIPFRIYDLSAEWRHDVAAYIGETYLAGKTPNPCIRCNERIKFGLLPKAAFADGFGFFATGHYAKTGVDSQGRAYLCRAVDRKKDQSYFLYRVRKDILARTIFPLGNLEKSEVRRIAAEFCAPVASKGDSQDFCGGDAMSYVDAPDREGDIVDVDGNILGRHRGFWHYTIGKRKGLGIGGGIPYYVVGLDARENCVVVAFKERAVAKGFKISSPVWLASDNDLREASESGELFVKVRSAGEPKGPVELLGDTCIVPDGLSGVAPGQSAVFYRADYVLGGGIIDSILI